MPIQIAVPLPSAAPLVEPSTLDLITKLLVLVLAGALFIALQATLPTPLPDEALQTIAGP